MEQPTITTFLKRADLPSLALPSLSDTKTYTTPSITVPPNHNNPYILRNHSPSGTVFIAVGAIVGAILLGFILYHLILSLSASKTAKKAFSRENGLYEKFSNNNTAYAGFSGNTALGNEFQSTGKLPLLTQSRTKSFTDLANYSNAGDVSTIYQTELGVPATKHDFSKMFISPTEEAMSHKRKSLFDSTNSFALMSGSTINLSNTSVARPANSTMGVHVPSESGSSGVEEPPADAQAVQARTRNQPARKSIPSMYLDDLIDS